MKVAPLLPSKEGKKKKKRKKESEKKEKDQYLTYCFFLLFFFFSSFFFFFPFFPFSLIYITGYISYHSFFFLIGLHQDGYTENSRYVIDPFFPFSPVGSGLVKA